jgi:5'-3' exonuclease
MQIHLLDATYELFRAHYGPRTRQVRDARGRPVSATVRVVEDVFGLLRQPGITHLACATDHVIRSWRNGLWPGYKTEAGMPPELLAQFPRVEDALRAAGVVVWAEVEFEADDAMAAAAARWADEPDVERVVIMSPDKDMAQCVREDGRVVTFNRRLRAFMDADAVRAKYGVSPESIPDYLALVGDSSDGYPGIPGWGTQSAAAVLRRYPHLEEIPALAHEWDVSVGNRVFLATSLREHWDEALLFRRLALLRTDTPIPETLDDLRWKGVPREPFEAATQDLGAPHLLGLVPRWRDDGATSEAGTRQAAVAARSSRGGPT